MKTVMIDRATAYSRIALDNAYVANRIPKAGSSIILKTGAVLIAHKHGAITRYYVSGYAQDGSDTDAALNHLDPKYRRFFA